MSSMRVVRTTQERPQARGVEPIEDPITIIRNLDDDEPVFVLRGNDILAIPFMRQYQMFTEDQFGPEKGQSLELLIDTMRDYQQHHSDRVKFPD